MVYLANFLITLLLLMLIRGLGLYIDVKSYLCGVIMVCIFMIMNSLYDLKNAR